MFAYYSDTLASIAITKMDFNQMKEGDVAGLAVFQDPYAFVGIRKVKGQAFVVMVNDGKTIDSSLVEGSTIYLRADAIHGSGATQYYARAATPGTGDASFSYSLDNKEFRKIGNDLHMKFNLRVFTGNKFCLFDFATRALGGSVDFDWFRTGSEGLSTSFRRN